MTCPRCGGFGVELRPGRETAVAGVCECTGECADCGGSGWVSRRGKDRYRTAARCTCAARQDRVLALNDAHIPARFSDCTLDNFVPRLDNHAYLVAYLERWIDGFAERNRGLLFCGRAGVGKTHLAVAVLRLLVLKHGVRGRFVEFFELLADIRASFGKPGGERAVMQPLVEEPLLVVDELGKGRGNDFEQSVLDQLIGARYNRSLPTIFTTNYPLGAQDSIQEQGQTVRLESLADVKRLLGDPPLEERVGARIYSRVLDMCKPFVLRGASDYRLQRIRGSDEDPVGQ